MPTTPEGDVVPSYMQVGVSSPESGFTMGLRETTLRFGQVINVYYPEDAGNVNKRFTEYDVSVSHVAAGGSQSQILYPRCQLASFFGGVADHLTWTPRVRLPTDSDSQGKAGLNSVVAVLCLNANIRQGIIIGGLKHPGLPKDTNRGQYLDFEFNGIRSRIDDSGTFSLFRKGATRADGTPVKDSDANAGASISLRADGNVVIANGDRSQYIGIGGPSDADGTDGQVVPNKALDIVADENLNMSANVVSISVPRESENSQTSQIYIGPGSPSEAAVLGSTYRTAENKMNSELSSQLKTIANAILIASQGIQAAAAAPGAQSLAGAAAALVEAGTALQDMAVAIDEFENPAAKYTSAYISLS